MPSTTPTADPSLPTNAAVRRTMVRGGAAAAIVATAAAVSAQPAAAANTSLRPYLNTTLRKGSRGKAVLALQKALRMSSRTGYFGPKTHAAVVKFQKKKRLPATGVVNNATWRALGGFPSAAAEAAAKAKANAEAARKKAAAEAAAREAKAKADAEAKRKAEAARLAKIEYDAMTANAARRAALLATTAPSVHAPGLALAADPHWHLARRLTYGPNATLLKEIKDLGATAWIERQLDPASIDDSAVEQIVAETWPDLNLPWIDLYNMKNADGNFAGHSYSNTWLQRATQTRRIFSQRQLFEMVVEMWHDHLHVTLFSDKVYGIMPSYDRMIRKHALGNFADMLADAINHPAMIAYLDNTWSTKTAANENLGRELLELHTVGVGAFTEADVKQAAYILTGTSHANYEPLYRPTYHYIGPVTVMGYTHPNPTKDSGPAALTGLLDYLAHHPATAKRIAEKMCRRFVSDSPSEALVAAVAAEFTRNNTAITPTLRFLFNHPEFKGAHGQKFRRPGEYITAIYRASNPTWLAPDKPTSVLGGGVGLPANYVQYLHDRLQHEPLAWPAPNGYPDVAPAWQSVSGLIVRANAPFYVVAKSDQTVKGTDWAAAYGITPEMSAYTVVDTLSEALTGYPFKKEHRDSLAQFLWDHTDATIPKYSEPVGTGRFWRLNDLIRLILASPYMNLR